MSRASDIIERGDPQEIISMALGARFAADEGRYCRCIEPALVGYALMCGNCLLESEGQIERATRRLREPHTFVSSREPDWLCDICAHESDHPRHASSD